jgi:GntR family transcriptional regulator
MLPFFIPAKAGRRPCEQIVQAARQAIRTGQLAAGDPFPPVRELARELHISPTTAQNAVAQLKASGHLASRPRQGTVVTSQTLEVRLKRLRPVCTQLLTAAGDLDLKFEEVVEALRRAETFGRAETFRRAESWNQHKSELASLAISQKLPAAGGPDHTPNFWDIDFSNTLREVGQDSAPTHSETPGQVTKAVYVQTYKPELESIALNLLKRPASGPAADGTYYAQLNELAPLDYPVFWHVDFSNNLRLVAFHYESTNPSSGTGGFLFVQDANERAVNALSTRFKGLVRLDANWFEYQAFLSVW